MNISLFTYFNNLSTNHFISDIVIFLHQYTYIIIGVIIILSIIISSRKFFTFALLFLSIIFAWLFAENLKSIFHIPRPFVSLGITPLVYQNGFSFPSQHMSVFSAIAVSIFLINKRFAIILLVLAILVGVSRVILGVHYPIDIIGGFFVGSIVSLVLIYFFKKI